MNAKRYLKITLLLISTLTVMAGALIAPALPKMAQSFGDRPDAAFLTKMVLTMPALLIAITSPFAGALVDRFGRLRLLRAAMIFYAIAGGAGLFLENIYWLLISRALLGMAVAFIMTIVTTLVGDYLEGEERGRFLGIQGGFMAFGGTVFVSVSGLLSDISWRLPFAVYLLSIPFLFFVYRYLHEPKAAEEGAEDAVLSVPTGGKLRLYLTVYATVFFGMALFYLAPAQLPFLMESIGVTQASLASIGLVVITLTAAVMSISYQRIKGYWTFQQVYVFTFLMMGLGFGSVFWATNFTGVVAAMAVAGLGAGLLMPNTSFCLLSNAPPRMRGRVLGGMTSAIFLGQFFSPVLVQPSVRVFEFGGTYLLSGLLSLVVSGIFLALVLRYRYRHLRWLKEGV